MNQRINCPIDGRYKMNLESTKGAQDEQSKFWSKTTDVSAAGADHRNL